MRTLRNWLKHYVRWDFIRNIPLILKYGKQVLESQESDENDKIIELDAREEKNNGIKEKRRVAFLREMCYI